MFNYFRRIDRKINNTLSLYQDIGKLSLPLFKYIILIVSVLIATSCIAIIISLFNHDSNDTNTEKNLDDIWVNYSLPIIIYGIICPVISALITVVFKFFIEFQFTNIINKYKYFHKKNGKYPNIFIELKNIFNFIRFDKVSFIIPISSIILFFNINTLSLILILFIDIFFIIYKLFQYYNNEIECKIIGVEKCNKDTNVFWRYSILIKYPNEKERIVKKRFNDFKELHQRLNILDNLPTSDWVLNPNNLKQVEERATELNIYLRHIISSNKAMSNSVFYNFFKEENLIESELILENQNFASQRIEDERKNDNLLKLKNKLSNDLEDNINDIFILNEINYYTVLKKRFYIFSDKSFYKLKLDNYNKVFHLRYKVDLINIYKIEISKIKNTNHLRNLDVLIINYGLNHRINKIYLTSLTNNNYYNIKSLYEYFKTKLNNCEFKESNTYMFDTGFGITESILHNYQLKKMKKFISKNSYLKSFFD